MLDDSLIWPIDDFAKKCDFLCIDDELASPTVLINRYSLLQLAEAHMFIKTLRQDRQISQEQLAEVCGLSLRTIQRAESGHRVSFASLRSLANAFEIDVDTLERELYAMKSVDEFTETPLWVRLLFSRGLSSKNRQSNLVMEKLLVIVGVVSFALCFSPFFDGKELDHGHLTIDDQLLYVGLIMFSGAYIFAATIRLGDKYSIWSHLKPA